MDTLNRLIQKIAAHPSTEELILCIADDKAMVDECLALQGIFERNNPQELDRINALCRSHQLTSEVLAREVRHILAIFLPESVNDEYAVLGLDADATPREIKQAFHRLSVKYHPDSSGSDTADKFIEICQAYKTIIDGAEPVRAAAPSAQAAAWHYRKKPETVSRKKRTNIYIFCAVAVLLLIISMIAPFFFKKKVMIKNLNTADPMVMKTSSFPGQIPASENNNE